MASKHTLADDGSPSNDPLDDLKRSLSLMQDERHLIAHELYSSTRRRIEDWKKEPIRSQSGKKSPKDKDKAKVVKTNDTDVLFEKADIFFQERKNEFDELEVSEIEFVYTITFIDVKGSHRLTSCIRGLSCLGYCGYI